MFIDSVTLKRINIYGPYKGFSKLDTPEIRERAGLIEIADPAPRGNDEIEYTQELDVPPYIIITPKSPEQLERQQDNKDADSAKRHLADTDYLFSLDRNATLVATEPERAVALVASREAAREVLRAFKIKYPVLP
jgi:hypothetical protein